LERNCNRAYPNRTGYHGLFIRGDAVIFIFAKRHHTPRMTKGVAITRTFAAKRRVAAQRKDLGLLIVRACARIVRASPMLLVTASTHSITIVARSIPFPFLVTLGITINGNPSNESTNISSTRNSIQIAVASPVVKSTVVGSNVEKEPGCLSVSIGPENRHEARLFRFDSFGIRINQRYGSDTGKRSKSLRPAEQI